MSTDAQTPDIAADAQRTDAAAPAVGGGLLDAGWLLLIPGIVIVAAVLVLPAADDVAAARFYRDRLLKVEEHRGTRMANYDKYLAALDKAEPQTVLALAAVNLNQAPVGMALIVPAGDISSRSASVFESLEPKPAVLPERVKHYSTLERLSIDPKSRVWLMLAGATLIFLGILPASRAS